MISTIGQRLSNGFLRRIQSISGTILPIVKLDFQCRCEHAKPSEVRMKSLYIKILPIRNNNYMYLVCDPDSKQAVAVDPADAKMIVDALDDAKMTLDTILITHHHEDHTAGNQALIKCFPGVRVLGGDKRIKNITCKIRHFALYESGNMLFRCLHTPGHTTGHFAFYLESTKHWDRAVFTGDSLLQGGVGPFSEGPPSEMYYSVCQVLYGLPDNTICMGGHELTIRNLELALKVEPNNEAAKKRLEWARKQKEECKPAEPSTIGDEKSWNPFMRVHHRCVQKYTKTLDPFCSFGKLHDVLYSKRDETK